MYICRYICVYVYIYTYIYGTKNKNQKEEEKKLLFDKSKSVATAKHKMSHSAATDFLTLLTIKATSIH